jgi:hypothetical protein
MSHLAVRKPTGVAPVGSVRRDLSSILAEGAAAARPAAPGRDIAVLPRRELAIPPEPTRTVGEHLLSNFTSGAGKIGRFLHGLAELTVVPLVGELAFIKGRQLASSSNRILDLPYDSDGRWKSAAARIKQEEARRASEAIADLPVIAGSRVVGEAVVDGTAAVGRAAVRGAEAVGDFAVDSTLTMVRGVREAGRLAGRTALGAIGDLGRSLVEFSEENRANFR